MTHADSDLDQALASIQSMHDVMLHLSAAADAALSEPPNDEIHRRWFAQLAEQIMSRAVSIGLIQPFRVQCDRENNPDVIAGTEHFKAHVFYRKSDAKSCSIELVLGGGDWFIIDNGEMESKGL